jgi:hypothetical protein
MNEIACILAGEAPYEDWPLVKPMHSHATRPFLAATTFIVLGVVEAKLSVAIADRWQSGRSIMLLAALAFPLSLVWLATLMSFLHGVLALFLPRLEFRSPCMGGRPGDTLNFTWCFPKRPTQLRELIVSLEGYQERRGGRGRRDCWRKTVLFFQTVFATTDLTHMTAGELPVTIPHDAKPTRLDKTHRIRWVIRVHGRAGCFPDLVDGYEVVVLPGHSAVSSTANVPN